MFSITESSFCKSKNFFKSSFEVFIKFLILKNFKDSGISTPTFLKSVSKLIVFSTIYIYIYIYIQLLFIFNDWTI